MLTRNAENVHGPVALLLIGAWRVQNVCEEPGKTKWICERLSIYSTLGCRR